jgi:hypothetical protein
MNSPKKSRAPSALPLPSGFPAPVPVCGAGDEAFWESHVAVRLGVAREKIALLRGTQLQEVADFTRQGNAVVYTAGGLARLTALVARAVPQDATDTAPAVSTLPADQIAPPPTAQPAPSLGGCQPERARVVVVRTLPNRKMMFVRRADAVPPAPTFIVRVKDNVNFHPRLAPFEVRRAADGQWLYLGRLPRSLGRW